MGGGEGKPEQEHTHKPASSWKESGSVAGGQGRWSHVAKMFLQLRKHWWSRNTVNALKTHPESYDELGVRNEPFSHCAEKL